MLVRRTRPPKIGDFRSDLIIDCRGSYGISSQVHYRVPDTYLFYRIGFASPLPISGPMRRSSPSFPGHPPQILGSDYSDDAVCVKPPHPLSSRGNSCHICQCHGGSTCPWVFNLFRPVLVPPVLPSPSSALRLQIPSRTSIHIHYTRNGVAQETVPHLCVFR